MGKIRRFFNLSQAMPFNTRFQLYRKTEVGASDTSDRREILGDGVQVLRPGVPKSPAVPIG